jgi:hypothetical protein
LASACLVIYLDAYHLTKIKSRDSSVGIATGYRLEGRGSTFRFPAGAGNFSLHHCVQKGSGTHTALYPMGAGGSFLLVKRPRREADHTPPTIDEVKNAWSYISSSPICLHDVVLG